jgi:hypothetical protein
MLLSGATGKGDALYIAFKIELLNVLVLVLVAPLILHACKVTS